MVTPGLGDLARHLLNTEWRKPAGGPDAQRPAPAGRADAQRAAPWRSDFLGVAYRYYDLRMNVVPLFAERAPAVDLWTGVIRSWIDPTIRLRFVESGDHYWFVLAAETRDPYNNVSLYKELPRSEHYERFKNGHEGTAYLRLGIHAKKYFDDVKDDALCNCGHAREDHDDGEEEDKAGPAARGEDGALLHDCLYEGCECAGFVSFQVTLLRKKKTLTDIAFLTEDEAKDDALAWNCLNANKYSAGRADAG